MHKIFLLGDSTASNKEESARPETGWGEKLELFLKPGWKVINKAKNGRSSKSFIDENLLNQVIDEIDKGDYALIQFGHNDSKPDKERHTDAYSSFVDNLIFISNEIRKKGATPILLTQVPRRKFIDEILQDTHKDYYHAVPWASNKGNIDYVDITLPSSLLVQSVGEELSKNIYNHTQVKEDNSHLSPKGAELIAFVIANEINKKLSVPFINLDKEESSIEDLTSIETVN